MQAVILAGGRGTRLGHLTSNTQKTMMRVNGKPFLQYLVEYLRKFDIEEILFLVGYLGNQIERHFGNGLSFGVKIDYSYERTILGTGGALINGEGKLKEEFLLLNGDTFVAMGYKGLLKRFHYHDKTGIVAAYDNSQNVAPSNLLLDESNYVIGYNKSNSKGMTHVDAGVLALKKTVVDFIPAGGFCSLEEEIFPRLMAQRELVAYPINQRFYDIGSLKGLEATIGVLR